MFGRSANRFWFSDGEEKLDVVASKAKQSPFKRLLLLNGLIPFNGRLLWAEKYRHRNDMSNRSIK
jgi:hypothetical protein